MRRLECCACGKSIQERIFGRLYRRPCLLCHKGILLEPEECYPEDGEDSELPQPAEVTKPRLVACWACKATSYEFNQGGLVGSVCKRCGEGRLLACKPA